jgi:hypothetical protein
MLGTKSPVINNSARRHAASTDATTFISLLSRPDLLDGVEEKGDRFIFPRLS